MPFIQWEKLPLNIGSSELVSIDEPVTMVERIAGLELKRRYKADAPTGVRGRNSDNTLIRARLGWEPSVTLERGMRATYESIWSEMFG